MAPGVLESTQAANDSQGKGDGGGGGTGRGTGIGAGEGSGLGQGSGGGTGGGTYRPGNGVTIPQLVREVKPAYTADAMRAKVQGTVWLECVVMPDGTVGRVEVVRSLDSTFGLDQEAIKAAKQWRFRPGTRLRRARARPHHDRAGVHAALKRGRPEEPAGHVHKKGGSVRSRPSSSERRASGSG